MKREVSDQSSVVLVIAAMVPRGPELPGNLSQIPDPQKPREIMKYIILSLEILQSFIMQQSPEQ